MKNKFEHIFFDFDGTLYDSSKELYQTLIDYINYFSLNVDKPTYADFINKSGLGGEKILDLYHFSKEELKLPRQEYINQFEQIFIQYNGKIGNLFPGADKLLEFLNSNGINWGIITNRRDHSSLHVIPQFKWFNINKNIIITSDTVEVAKPDPRVLTHAINHFKAKHETTIFVGDSVADMQLGNNLKIPTVCCLYGFIHDLEEIKNCSPTYFVNSPIEIVDILND